MEISQIHQQINTHLKDQLKRPLQLLYISPADWMQDGNSSLDKIYRSDSIDSNTFPTTSLDVIYFHSDLLSQLLALGNTAAAQFFIKLSQKTAILLINIEEYRPKSSYLFRLLFSTFAYAEPIFDKSSLPKSLSLTFFASNHYCYAKGNFHAFENWAELTPEPSHKHPANIRRYYFSYDKLLKFYYFADEKNGAGFANLNREITFLAEKNPIVQYQPRLIAFHFSYAFGWLLREKVPGICLNTAIAEQYPFQPKAIILGILEQLANLEAQGLYHDNLCTRNVLLLSSTQPVLINYSAIQPMQPKSEQKIDKKHQLLRFLVFVYEVAQKQVMEKRRFSPMIINKKYYPSAYHDWIQQLLSADFKQWSFGFLLKLWQGEEIIQPESLRVAETLQLWLDKIEGKFNRSWFRIKNFERCFIKKLSKGVTQASDRFLGAFWHWL